MFYRCSIPMMTPIVKGATVKVIVSIDTPDGKPLRRGEPGHTDRDFQVRFETDRKVVEVTEVRKLQTFLPGHEEFGGTYTRGEPGWGVYVINHRMAYPGPLVPSGGFDIQPGPLYEITLVGKAKGSCLLDLTKCTLGAFDKEAFLVDGILTVA